LVGVLGLTPDYMEAFQDIDDVIDPSSLYRELLGTLVQIQKILAHPPIKK
jgi:hypothetical protein